MARRLYAVWVKSVAGLLAADRAAVIDFARSQPEWVWEKPTEVDGWTCKHVLAHLAGGNDQLLQTLLEATINRGPLSFEFAALDTDAENARRIKERLAWPAERLIEELEADGDRVDEMLSQLGEHDRGHRVDGFPMTMRQFLDIVKKERHDLLHLEQLKRATQ